MEGSSYGTVRETPRDGIYYEITPFKITFIRVFGGICFLFALVSVALVGVKSHSEHNYIFLLANIIMSVAIALLMSWFWKKGYVEPQKWWIIVLTFSALLYQSFVSVLYSYRHENSQAMHTMYAKPHSVAFPLHTVEPPHHPPSESMNL